MTAENVSAIAVFVLIVWGLVFAGLHRRRRSGPAVALQMQRNRVLERCACILERAGAALTADNRVENSSDGVGSDNRTDPAEEYLRRIVALTGATQMGNDYVLNVGNARFRVHYRYVSRVRDIADPNCADEETCFYPVHKGMPRTEEIATALLQLSSNPALFDKWATQNGLAFKADGQVFTRAR